MGENAAAMVMPHESLPRSYKGNSDGDRFRAWPEII
jgi:hypothetical protein